jgi:hypothetical protein
LKHWRSLMLVKGNGVFQEKGHENTKKCWVLCKGQRCIQTLAPSRQGGNKGLKQTHLHLDRDARRQFSESGDIYFCESCESNEVWRDILGRGGQACFRQGLWGGVLATLFLAILGGARGILKTGGRYSRRLLVCLQTAARALFCPEGPWWPTHPPHLSLCETPLYQLMRQYLYSCTSKASKFVPASLVSQRRRQTWAAHVCKSSLSPIPCRPRRRPCSSAFCVSICTVVLVKLEH